MCVGSNWLACPWSNGDFVSWLGKLSKVESNSFGMPSNTGKNAFSAHIIVIMWYYYFLCYISANSKMLTIGIMYKVCFYMFGMWKVCH